MDPRSSSPDRGPGWPGTLIFGALAGGMGWGIRGQYGHETGAMIAGVLLGLTLVVRLGSGWPALPALRAAAAFTVAIGFGGSMTYGQTIGLTQNAHLIGRWDALAWGLLGLAIKGALWIGWAGLVLGWFLGRRRPRPIEVLVFMVIAVVLFFAGTALLNSPFDPAQRRLPAVYFSETWHWSPDREFRPRREVWGGLLVALLGALAWARWVAREPLALRLAGWGLLGGALGFPGGQLLQAFHAWNPALFQAEPWVRLDPYINWWNWMETTFGAIFGALLALGCWRNRHELHPPAQPPASVAESAVGMVLLLVHASALVVIESDRWPAAEAYAEIGLVLGLLPLVAVTLGAWSSPVLLLPVVVLPIAVRMALRTGPAGSVAPWILPLLMLLLAVGVAGVTAARLGRKNAGGGTAAARGPLLAAVWIWFLLNLDFFQFAWPWREWTMRTPNALMFLAAAVGLTLLARRKPCRPENPNLEKAIPEMDNASKGL